MGSKQIVLHVLGCRFARVMNYEISCLEHNVQQLWRESLAQDYRLGRPSDDQIASRVLDGIEDGFARLIERYDAGAPDLDHRYPPAALSCLRCPGRIPRRCPQSRHTAW